MQAIGAGELSATDAARELGVSRATLYRAMGRSRRHASECGTLDLLAEALT